MNLEQVAREWAIKDAGPCQYECATNGYSPGFNLMVHGFLAGASHILATASADSEPALNKFMRDADPNQYGATSQAVSSFRKGWQAACLGERKKYVTQKYDAMADADQFFKKEIAAKDAEIERIKKIAQSNYDRAEEVNKQRTVEIRTLESRIQELEVELLKIYDHAHDFVGDGFDLDYPLAAALAADDLAQKEGGR
jgi:hypothetical protein